MEYDRVWSPTPRTLDIPLRTRKAWTYRLGGDTFHENVTDNQLDQIFAVMALAPQHTFQVLTKRPERARAYLGGDRRADSHATERIGYLIHEWQETGTVRSLPKDAGAIASALIHGPTPDVPNVAFPRPNLWPLPNVWLGVSAEDQATADARIPVLLDTPAAVRFVSMEPLLGPVDLTRLEVDEPDRVYGFPMCDALRGSFYVRPEGEPAHIRESLEQDRAVPRRHPSIGLDWVIVGGESGKRARPMHPDWARSLRDQCAAAGVAFHFKQWGAWAPKGWVHNGTPFGPGCGAWNSSGQFVHSRDELTANGNFEMQHVGRDKKKAGRLLDGVTHDGFPETSA